MRDTGLAATKKFLPKGGEHSSAALRRGKAVRMGSFWKNCAGKDYFSRVLASVTLVVLMVLGCGSSRSRSLAFRGGSLVAFPADADELGDAGLLHGDAVEDGAGLHGFAVVGDDDELRLAAHITHEAGEAADVGFVEGRIDFVKDTEGARLIAEDGDEQSERSHGLFPAGEQENVLHALARRRSDHVDAGVAGAVDLGQAHFGHAAAEDGVEGLR